MSRYHVEADQLRASWATRWAVVDTLSASLGSTVWYNTEFEARMRCVALNDTWDRRWSFTRWFIRTFGPDHGFPR